MHPENHHIWDAFNFRRCLCFHSMLGTLEAYNKLLLTWCHFIYRKTLPLSTTGVFFSYFITSTHKMKIHTFLSYVNHPMWPEHSTRTLWFLLFILIKLFFCKKIISHIHRSHLQLHVMFYFYYFVLFKN